MMMYGSEVWALKKSDKKRIAAGETKFMRRTAGMTLRDRVPSEKITADLGVKLVMKKRKQFRKD